MASISLSSETLRLLEARMREGDYKSPEELIRVALEGLEGEPVEALDAATQAAIERAEAQAEAGQGMELEDAFDRLRRKYIRP